MRRAGGENVCAVYMFELDFYHFAAVYCMDIRIKNVNKEMIHIFGKCLNKEFLLFVSVL